jgi:hypothetical protein
MNNTKNILLVAIITVTLVLGTSVIPMQSYADRGDSDDKKDKDFESKTSASSESDKKSASQKLDQDNFCYGGDDCEQANQGQQIVGKDNEAKGFNDQSLNVQQTVTPTPTQPPTPKTGTLNVCKTVVNDAPGVTFQPSDFTFTFASPANPSTFQGNNEDEGCTAVTVAQGTFNFTEIFPPSVIANTLMLSGGCESSKVTAAPRTITFNGTIAEGETQTCSIINTIDEVTP